MEKIKYSLIGNKERCFDLKYSQDASHLLSASEDGTAKLWNIQTRQTVQSLTHNSKCEVLRSSFISNGMICTCGSDGNAILWKQADNSIAGGYTKLITLPHDDQIYACVTTECISSPHVITASDNLLHIWDLTECSNNHSYSISFQSLTSLLDQDKNSQIESFGGPRNPDNKAFIFDVQPAASSGIQSNSSHEGNPFWTSIALALSDGTIRIVDLRNPSEAHTFLVTRETTAGGGHAHATGVTWTPDKLNLIATSGSGDLILFDLRMSTTRGSILAAHDSSCFGTCFQNNNSHSSKFTSWSSDGSLRLWDYNSIHGECSRTLSLNEILIPNYPIYCAASNPNHNSQELVIGGGSSQKSFMGPLIHVIDIWNC